MESIANRIKELIETLQLTNSDFAKKAKLNPATVSHILSGRNKASLQVIENIKETFTDVNIDYLITGQGSLFIPITNVNNEKPASADGSLFPMEGLRVASVGTMPTPAPQEQNKVTDVNRSVKEDIQSPSEQGMSSSVKSQNELKEKEIERIVIFYTDGSFSSYHP
jgi:transcriptional regulator with XRE-family HTH domain